MGGSSSTRKLTFEEDDGPGMVKISGSVLKRLKGEEEIGDNATDQTFHKPQEEEKRTIPRTSESDIVRLEKHYKEKLNQLETLNAQLYHQATDEFSQAVQDVEKKFLKYTTSPVCQDLQNDVLKCYKENPKQTLLCSTQVKSFLECVEKTRQTVLTKKG